MYDINTTHFSINNVSFLINIETQYYDVSERNVIMFIIL